VALPSDYISGTITLENGSANFTGTGTGWLAADFREGDVILDIVGGGNRIAVIQEITGNGAGELTELWEGPDLTAVAYRMRYQWDSSRVSAQSRAAIEMLGNGNLQSFAAVTGPGVVVMDGLHSVTVKPETDFINGVAYDVQVDALADRAAYDGQSAGFSVLVSNIGDGRSAVYSKASNTVGDWTDPAYVTGPSITLNITEVSSVPFGDPPDVTLIPITGGYNLEFEIPLGMIIEPGTTTTLSSDQPAAVTFVPITGGYRLDLAIPRGPTGDIDGVTTFWQSRITNDADAATARAGLGLLFANQAEAEAGADNAKLMTALRSAQQRAANLASEDEAVAASNNSKLMTPFMVGRAISKRQGFEPIGHIDAAGLSIVQFNDSRSAEFDSYEIEAHDILGAGSGLELGFRVLTGAGVELAGTSYRHFHYRSTIAGSASGGANPDSYIALTRGELMTNSLPYQTVNTSLKIHGPTIPSFRQCMFRTTGFMQSSDFLEWSGGGYIVTNDPFTGFRFILTGFTAFERGQFTLYGKRKIA